ncbi:hypothetical protein ACODT5_23185 [Streptomyces sp. 5.8]|uniref:hypothetical protein n=1 Tax=Streptomyces sp. 5.8 TaxID=3406571 RepID=UPI003BB54F44
MTETTLPPDKDDTAPKPTKSGYNPHSEESESAQHTQSEQPAQSEVEDSRD